MSVTVSHPAPGIRLVTIPDTEARFKTASLTVQLLTPLAKETAARQAILPFLLRRGCRAYPDFAKLKRRLDALYCAQVTASVERLGEAQALYLQVTCLDDRFALAGETIAADCAELLRGMLFEPPFTDEGVFAADAGEEERRCLIENIRAEINNKRAYAYRRCRELLCEGEPFALSETGTVEAVAALTPADITDAWRRVLATARVQIIYQGTGDGEAVAAPFLRGFAAIDRAPVDLPILRRPHEGEVRYREERMAVAQSKMVLGLRSSATAEEQDARATYMANAIFGGTAISMLFRTVREALSLCYYCSSGFVRLKGVAFIDCGVEEEKIPAAREEILRQLARLQAGEFTDTDIENTRRFLISQYRTVNDTQSALANWYGTQVLDNAPLSPEQAAKELAAVTRERIVAAANTLQLACEFCLLPNGEEADGDE